MPRIPHCLDNRLTDGGKVISLEDLRVELFLLLVKKKKWDAQNIQIPNAVFAHLHSTLNSMFFHCNIVIIQIAQTDNWGSFLRTGRSFCLLQASRLALGLLSNGNGNSFLGDTTAITS
jgi:hypothetical protein